MFDFISTKLRPSDQKGRVLKLAIDKIVPNPSQPRQSFELSALQDLADSIQEYGLIQPIVVRPKDDCYELIAGERRLRACKLLGKIEIDAIMMTATDKQSACLALVENLQRENLHYFEEAESFATLMELFSLTQGEFAQSIGKKQSTVANKIRVCRLPTEVKQRIVENGLTERHARALLLIADEEDQLNIIQQIADEGLNVKDSEALIQHFLMSKQQQKKEDDDEKKPMRISAIKDYRLFVNTMRTAVNQLKIAGVEAEFKVQENDDEVYVTVAIPKKL